MNVTINNYKWVGNISKNLIDFQNWENGEPSLNGCCVLINQIDGTWNDIPCERTRHAVCGICGIGGSSFGISMIQLQSIFLF